MAGIEQVTPRATAGSAARAVAPPHGTAPATYADYARNATVTLERTWLTGDAWRMCLLSGCPSTNWDWGADAFTYTLSFRWHTSRDAALVPYLRRLIGTTRNYSPCSGRRCAQWSDVPLWDSVAAAREYEATGDATALERAEHAFSAVQNGNAYYARGACPQIRYQQSRGGRSHLKTLEKMVE